jgi:hypothetical protein
LPPEKALIPDFDIRSAAVAGTNVTAEQKRAVESLKKQLGNGATVEFDKVTGSPKSVSAGAGFLTGPGGVGKAVSPQAVAQVSAGDTNKVVKAFLMEHRGLFGFGPEALDNAKVTRAYEAPHNGLRTVVWEQQVQGIPVFEAVFISHTTKRGELVNVASQFMRDPEMAAAAYLKGGAVVPKISAQRALETAVKNVGSDSEELRESTEADSRARTRPSDAGHQHRFKGKGLKGEATVKLIWLPMSRDRLTLCWDVVFMAERRGEMFQVLVDTDNGQVLLRRCLTEYISDASYRIFTNDSPTPMSPGLSTPATNQPPLVSSALVTISALDTNASPNGWINDGDMETLGNNVDAHTDHNGTNMPDLPRPNGGTNRVFDFTMDLTTDDPMTYSSASIVNAFYWCNWMHDRLYDLGFTEAAGNFQTTNFGRGGIEGDPVLTDCQDGSGYNNANFSTPVDGSSGRMQLYLFTGPTPWRDGALDVEVVLHEYTHGMSNRRVGGGVLISALQSKGMGEGWSDFYALSMLSEPADDPNANYPFAGYVSYLLAGTLNQNYYFGVRRYPYTTDISKNPLTFKDIDPTQASDHTGVPRSPVIGSSASEIHNQGEVWCVTLWDARANLIGKYGGTNGNALMMQLVADAMDLSPPNPTFLQARDAILQADLVDTGGANQHDFWKAFAKRGMGFSASAPASSTTTGVVESFECPDDLRLSTRTGFISSGPLGGPFLPNSMGLTLTNVGTNTLSWGLSITSTWLNASSPGDVIPAGTNQTITIGVDSSATNLSAGIYNGSVLFTNSSGPNVQAVTFILKVGQPDPFTELFDASDFDLAFRRFTFTPDNSVSTYAVCQEPAHVFPTDPQGGIPLTLADDDYAEIDLSGTNTVQIYGTRTNVVFVGSNGYLTMTDADDNYLESLGAHFSLPRISALFHDLNPEMGGTISWKELSDRFVVTYQGIVQYGSPFGNNFQVEMFYDGRLRITYLDINCLKALVGLSAGTGVPPAFVESDFSGYDFCPAVPPVFLSQPVGALLLPGTNIVLSSVATGAERLIYQWQKDGTNLSNGGNISGVTSSNLSLVNLTESNSGQYQLVVTNEYASITSSIAVVTVTAVDHFVWQHIPSPQSVAVPFTVGLEARDASDVLASNFNGTVLLTVTNAGINVSPAACGPFTNGVWSGALTLNLADTNVEIVANDGLGHTGATDLAIVTSPQLAIQMFTNNFYLVWTAGAPALKLETATNLDVPVWVEIPGPTQIGDQYVVPFITDEPARFYRLRYGN